MRYVITLIIMLTASAAWLHAAVAGDTISAPALGDITVTALKQPDTLQRAPVSATALGHREAQRLGILTVKGMSEVAPNFYIPDYGSRMTSTIYVRGIGARIDQPVVGLNVDNVAYLNKDNFDFDIADIARIEVLRGPQSALYGRNTMGGVVNITTLSPLRYQGVRAAVEVGTGGLWRFAVSGYKTLAEPLGMSLTVQGNTLRGWVKNLHTDRYADGEAGAAARWKTVWTPGDAWHIQNAATVSLSRQDGYPYAWEQTGTVSYNDTCSYARTSFSDGLTVSWQRPGSTLRVASITSAQYIDDDMRLDQDFLTLSYFTLRQRRREWAFTEDVMVSGRAGRYAWTAGAFAFLKRSRMHAPVLFKETGIAELIEGHRNKYNPAFPVRWDDDTFLLESRFRPRNAGAAIYHRSSVDLGRWTLTLDLRLDYEDVSLRYRSACDASYTTYNLLDPDRPEVWRHTPVVIDENRRLSQHFAQLLPRLAVTYLPTDAWTLYATAAKGYKAGGYNTQMFSDVLQQQVMQTMGVSPKYDVNTIVSYRPETSWNYEVGAKYFAPDVRLQGTAALFWIECRDQQVTTFPDGTTTGRIMTNAGRTRSRGLELSATWQATQALEVRGSYGVTDARFVTFDNGQRRYDGLRVPYVPQNTLFAAARYTIGIKAFTLALEATLRGVGSIYWDEANTRRQPFYLLPGASATLARGRWQITLRGDNLSNTRYDTFSYVSISNMFFQRGKPLRGSVTFRMEINTL